MKRQEFVEEVLNSEERPENFTEIYAKFETIQKRAFDALVEFHRICEKYNISYVLAYGSLLGIIRDGGQIPWDYDIDTFVPFEEKDRLIEALKKELNDDYYFYCIENNKKCRHMIMRITPKEYRSEDVHVDIFYLTGTPDDENKKNEIAKRIAKISDIRYYKLVKIKENAEGSIKHVVKLILKKIQYLYVNTSKITKEYNKLCSMYNAKDSATNIKADIEALKEQYNSKLIWDSKLMKMDNGQEFRIPKFYDEVLTKMYGDYKKIPSLDQRIKEIVQCYKKIIKYK